MFDKMINNFMAGFSVLFDVFSVDFVSFICGLFGFIFGLAVVVAIVMFVIFFIAITTHSIRKLFFTKED